MNPPMADFILAQTDALNAQFRAGLECARVEARRELVPLFAAYDSACRDVNTKIPTKLHMVIEALRKSAKMDTQVGGPNSDLYPSTD